MHQIGLQIDYHFTKNSKVIMEKLENYAWWASMIKLFCTKANHFEIRCWTGDTAAINVGERFGKMINNSTTEELVFQGDFNNAFLEEITNNYLTTEDTLKWFTLNIYKDDTMLFMSSHYGSEVHLFNLSDVELQIMMSFIEQYPYIKIFHLEETVTTIKNETTECSDKLLYINDSEIQDLKDTFLKYFR
jgi:hypothetical protein